MIVKHLDIDINYIADNHSFAHEAAIEAREGDGKGYIGADSGGNVEVELVFVHLAKDDHVGAVYYLFHYEIFDGGLFHSSSEVEHVSSDFVDPHWLSVVHNSDPRLVLRVIVQGVQWDFLLIHSHLLETVVVADRWVFDVNLELARLAHLEEARHEDHSGEEFPRPHVFLLSVAWVQPVAKDVQDIAEDIRFHLSKIVRPFF